MHKENAIGLVKGYTFSFEDGGRRIDAWFGAISGLETVSVDGELISSRRNYSTDSCVDFKLGQDEYCINLKVVSLLKGPFVCTLMKNGVAIRRQRLVFARVVKTSRLPFFIELLFFVFLASALGCLVPCLHLPQEMIYFSYALFFSMVVVYQLSTRKWVGALIEDEEVP